LSDPARFKQTVEQIALFKQEAFDEWSKKAYQYAADYFRKQDYTTTYLKLFS